MSLAAISTHPAIDQPAAWDREAEQALLGAALTDPQAASQPVAPTDLYQPAHATIWAAIQHMRNAGRTVDPITLADHLETTGQLEQAGGRPYLAELVAAVTVTANAAAHAEIIRKHATRRAIQDAAARITQLAHTPTDDPATILTAARDRLDKATPAAIGVPAALTMAQIMDDVLDTIGKPEAAGLATPWPDLNQIIGGLRSGTLTVIGARPGVGKSMAALNLAEHVADRQHRPVLFVSLEMRAREIALRRLASASGVDLSTLTRHKPTAAQNEAVDAAAVRLADSPMWVADDPGQTVAQIRQAVTDLAPALLVVDYLQLLTPERREQNREREVAEQSRRFKLLAMEADIPVVVLSQINRGPAARTDKRPELTDLRESGAIENDADCVWLLHHPDADDTSRLAVHVAKNRNGNTGRIELLQQGWLARIVSVTKPAWRYSDEQGDES